MSRFGLLLHVVTGQGERTERIKNRLAAAPIGATGAKLKCNHCGERGWVAVNVKCTKCRATGSWGWYHKT